MGHCSGQRNWPQNKMHKTETEIPIFALRLKKFLDVQHVQTFASICISTSHLKSASQIIVQVMVQLEALERYSHHREFAARKELHSKAYHTFPSEAIYQRSFIGATRHSIAFGAANPSPNVCHHPPAISIHRTMHEQIALLPSTHARTSCADFPRRLLYHTPLARQSCR